MSLVNAFINQIGREIGHDVYRNLRIRSSKHIPTISYTDFNENFKAEIKSFELAAYDKVSVRSLINLIEKSEKINPRSFNWQDCYIELDNKIDFCKEHLDKEHLDKLETLDTKNAMNFSVANEQHKNHIAQTIEKIKKEITKYESLNLALGFLLSLIGMNPIYFKMNFGKIFGHLFGTIVGAICFYYGYVTYIDPIMHHGNLPIENEAQIKIVKNVGIAIIVIGSIFYFPVLITSIKRIMNLKKINSNNHETLSTLTKYLEEVTKSK
ncbi:MAG: hypothetical protein ACK504_12590 [Bacteroidota bacterium]